MFNQKKPDAMPEPAKPAMSVAMPQVGPKPVVAYTNSGEHNYSIINEWLTMRGDLESSGDILVKGKVHGNIHCKMLIVDTEAQVEGGIVSEEVVIRGSTRGVIRSKRVRVEKSGNVDSEIYHQTFSAEEGARVRGTLNNLEDMADAPAEQPRHAEKSKANGAATLQSSKEAAE